MCTINRDLFKCSICTDVFMSPTTVGCGHTFCKECITTWLKNTNKTNKTCPMCNNLITGKLKKEFEKNIIIDEIMDIIFPERAEFERKVAIVVNIVNDKKYDAYILSVFKEIESVVKDNTTILDVSQYGILTLNIMLTRSDFTTNRYRYFEYNSCIYLYKFKNLEQRALLIQKNPEIFSTVDVVVKLTHNSYIDTKKDGSNRIQMIRSVLASNPKEFDTITKLYEQKISTFTPSSSSSTNQELSDSSSETNSSSDSSSDG